MSKVQMLRSVVNQRLTAAAQEIFGLFERTISEYEEELSASKEENERQRRLLDAVFNPEVRIHRADTQQLLVVKREVTPEQQDWNSSLDQEDPEPPYFKEEQEELWISQEGEKLQGQEEAGIKFSVTTVKSEDNEEEAQSSQLHQRQNELMETEAAGEEVRSRSGTDIPLQPAAADETLQSSECETDDSRHWEETHKPQSDLNPEAGSFGHKGHLEKHTEFKTGVKPFSCSVCGKRFTKRSGLMAHFRIHTEEKPFACSVCKKTFRSKGEVETHERIHTGEKPFSCAVCSKRFSQQSNLRKHMNVHTGEKPFSCSVCNKRFTQRSNLRKHSIVHTGEKPFSCSVCNKRFTQRSNLGKHLCLDERKKTFTCSVCKARFIRLVLFKKHKCVQQK